MTAFKVLRRTFHGICLQIGAFQWVDTFAAIECMVRRVCTYHRQCTVNRACKSVFLNLFLLISCICIKCTYITAHELKPCFRFKFLLLEISHGCMQNMFWWKICTEAQTAVAGRLRGLSIRRVACIAKKGRNFAYWSVLLWMYWDWCG